MDGWAQRGARYRLFTNNLGFRDGVRKVPLAATRGVGFIDLFPIFLDDEDPETSIRAHYTPFDVHWSAAGHRRVAETLLQGEVLSDLVAAARERAGGE